MKIFLFSFLILIGCTANKTPLSIDELRKRLETVYAETRILGNPEGYQLDSNYHKHLANGTNNTDWMFRYELAMNEKIIE